MLPGDEIVEKKHQNIKVLTSMKEGALVTKAKTRSWPGLGKNEFNIDYE